MASAVNDPNYQIHTHLLYELHWLHFSAIRFSRLTKALARPGQRIRDEDAVMQTVLIDSAAVHGRCLLEFARIQGATKDGERQFTLRALNGSATSAGWTVIHDQWWAWPNNRVLHMYAREQAQEPWPDGVEPDDPERLLRLAEAVQDVIEAGGALIKPGAVRDGFDEVAGAARSFLTAQSEAARRRLGALHDDSKAHRGYNDGATTATTLLRTTGGAG